MTRRRRPLTTTCIALTLALVTATAACDAPRRGLDDAGLAALIEALLPPIAEASGLAIRRPVDFALQSREDARAFVEQQLDEQRAEMVGMERAYKKLGLLPDTLDLPSLLLDLYIEQVVGYYDPRTSILYVVEGIPAGDAEPVVAHELVHALQDQHTDLDALVAPQRGNDRQMAAQAAAEGQATLVMFALQAAESAGQPLDPAALPDLAPLLGPILEDEHARFPVFAGAPRIVRESLLFPYLHGTAFVQALHRHRPRETDPPVPFGDLLPTSTQQVMHPVDRFIRARTEPLELRLGPAAAGWTVAYENTIGQFEMAVLLTEYLGPAAADIADGWAGDRYILLDGSADEEVLLWYSAWHDTAAADRFATRYRQLLGGRGGLTFDVSRTDHDGHPIVRVLQAQVGTDLDVVPLPPLLMVEPRPDL